MENTQKPNAISIAELSNLFFELYKGLNRAYGSYTILGTKREDGKVNGRAKTEIGVYEASLWAKHLTGATGLGVVPIRDDNTCCWGAIDVDVYPIDYEAVEAKIRKLGLPLVMIKTKSGGVHLTMFFSEPIPCKLARSRLYEIAMAMGYGGVEIFPKQIMLASNNDVGNWLNMPYFDYEDTTRYAMLGGKKLSAAQFLDLAHKVRISKDQLNEIELKLEGAFEDGPPCLQMISRGGAPEGSRNNTLFAMGVYSKMKYDDDWTDKIEEMNVEFISPPLKSKEVQIIIKSASRKDYFYPCNKAPLISHCNKDLCKKRPFGVGQGEQEFQLNLGSLVKISSEPPIWIIDVDGMRLQLDTEDLMIQERFRKVCMMTINKLPPVIKRNEWEKLIREKLEAVEVIDAPAESRQADRIEQYAVQYLTNTPPARVANEILLGRPFYDKEAGKVCFRGNDLIKYLENSGFRVEPRKIWNSLRDSGAQHGQMKVKGVPIQVWKVDDKLVPNMKLDLPEDEHEEF